MEERLNIAMMRAMMMKIKKTVMMKAKMIATLKM